MRLSTFIDRDMQAILAKWDSFAAAQLPAAAIMDFDALRDHAEDILRAVMKDLNSGQTPAEQLRKSLGRAPRLSDAPETAAETHAFLRAKGGFDINQMTAEYRALRASVLHMWADACKPDPVNVEDMVRFNEAIDQALAESVAFFSANLVEGRNLLLGMLGHDMRGPLHVIQMSATILGRRASGDDSVSTVAARIARSGAQLKALLDDLIDYNRTNWGLGIHVAPVDVDLAELFSDALEQLRAGYPRRVMHLQIQGDGTGRWDPNRLRQVLENLVVNALKYGDRESSVTVRVEGHPQHVSFSVINNGARIDDAVIDRIFDPLFRSDRSADGKGSEGSVGLGLYIARLVAQAHGGDITVSSTEGETAFTVNLPRFSSLATPAETETLRLG